MAKLSKTLKPFRGAHGWFAIEADHDTLEIELVSGGRAITDLSPSCARRLARLLYAAAERHEAERCKGKG
jgi:hypothetical protein